MTSITIVGAGLAGLVLADELLSQGGDPREVRLLEAGDPCQRASGAPATLLNPITGRSVYPKEGHLEAYLFAEQWLSQLQNRFGSDWIHRLPTTRAILQDKGGRKARNSYDQALEAGAFPPWLRHRWQDNSEIAGLQCDATLTFDVGHCLSLKTLLGRLVDSLESRGVRIERRAELLAVSRSTDGGWELKTSRGVYKTAQVVWAVGAALSRWFPGLPLSRTGGELLLGTPPEGVELPCILIRSGHLAPLPDGRWALGSTYRHRPRLAEEDDAWVKEWLFARMEVVFPAVRGMSNLEVWSSVRAVMVDNRLPIAGPVPHQLGHWVLGGLASKGVLWTPTLARSLARQLKNDPCTLPSLVQTSRLDEAAWTPDWSPELS